MVSRTRMTGQVRRFEVDAIRLSLAEAPELLDYRDDRGRNWLHLVASVDTAKHPELDVLESIRLAALLLELGLPVNGAAFSEGTWQATPLWYAVARGRNLALATWLLDAGSSPEHCLWAAGFRDDEDMLRLLIRRGANLEARAEGETPLLGAAKVSRFVAARILLEAGADPDFADNSGMTALHYMLRKGSDPIHLELFVDHGARGDIPGPDGRTAAELLSRKRDKRYQTLAERLRSTAD